GIEHAEDSGNPANADRQCRNCNGRKCRVLANLPHPVTDVARKLLHPRPAPRIPALFAEVQCVSESAPPLGPHHLAVSRHFVLQLLFEPTPIQQEMDLPKDSAHGILLMQSEGWLGSQA